MPFLYILPGLGRFNKTRTPVRPFYRAFTSKLSWLLKASSLISPYLNLLNALLKHHKKSSNVVSITYLLIKRIPCCPARSPVCASKIIAKLDYTGNQAWFI